MSGKKPGHRQQQTERDKKADMIGLPNVDKNLVGIEQVIDSNGIEAGLEFIEKEEFDEEEKNLAKNYDQCRA